MVKATKNYQECIAKLNHPHILPVIILFSAKSHALFNGQIDIMTSLLLVKAKRSIFNWQCLMVKNSNGC